MLRITWYLALNAIQNMQTDRVFWTTTQSYICSRLIRVWVIVLQAHSHHNFMQLVELLFVLLGIKSFFQANSRRMAKYYLHDPEIWVFILLSIIWWCGCIAGLTFRTIPCKIVSWNYGLIWGRHGSNCSFIVSRCVGTVASDKTIYKLFILFMMYRSPCNCTSKKNKNKYTKQLKYFNL